jgi:uncharacterized membrane protein YjfL (UPF0719 family)
MDFQAIFFASYETILSLIFGLVTVYISTRILNLTFLKSARNGSLLLENNTAASIFAGMMIICILILVHSSVLPSVDALRTMVLGQNKITFSIVALSFGYFLLFYLIALVISLSFIWLTVQIYMVATVHVDEIKEIRKNNIAVAIILSSVLLGMTLFIRPPVNRFISSLVNYESLEIIKKKKIPTTKKQGIKGKETTIPQQKIMPE